jgi:hypothetical protein
VQATVVQDSMLLGHILHALPVKCSYRCCCPYQHALCCLLWHAFLAFKLLLKQALMKIGVLMKMKMGVTDVHSWHT